ncbi:alpha/beta fold hydrolase [Bacillus tuaregi]|uniref:alpha/beta fold hydrolase n=1 Tax=Bacillus tuaregi TaxID=1816695 RepID=UPI0008F8EA71|nr:alpha/beta hydrolase [Bacillus tuaregi]
MVRGLILSNTTSYIPSLLAFHGIRAASFHLKMGRRERLVEQIVKSSLYDHSYQEEAKNSFLIRDTYLQSAWAPVGINYFPLLPTIKKPVLLIGGTQDRITPVGNLFLMKPYFRNVRIALLRKTGHLSNIERKEYFNQYVGRFIAQCVS